MTYRVLAHGPERRFEIVGGLRPSYGPASEDQLFATNDVIREHHAWQKHWGMILAMIVMPVDISYGWWEDEDTLRSAREPGFAVSGTINPLYQSAMEDDEARAWVHELAAHLGKALYQIRMYVVFMGDIAVLEQEES